MDRERIGAAGAPWEAPSRCLAVITVCRSEPLVHTETANTQAGTDTSTALNAAIAIVSRATLAGLFRGQSADGFGAGTGCTDASSGTRSHVHPLTVERSPPQLPEAGPGHRRRSLVGDWGHARDFNSRSNFKSCHVGIPAAGSRRPVSSARTMEFLVQADISRPAPQDRAGGAPKRASSCGP